MGEGSTPLVRSRFIEKEIGCGELYFKLEGCNPTGSFKDRGMVMAVAKAIEAGNKAIICASTGNTSASAAAYGAYCGIKTIVLVPSGNVAKGKMAQALAYGAEVVVVEGTFDQSLEMVRNFAERNSIALVNSVNPYRLEGQKSAAFEIVDDLGDSPEYLFIPVGNAGNITAYWNGFVQYYDVEKSTIKPRMMGFQAEGAAPIVIGEPVLEPETIASAIRIGNPASWQHAVKARDESGGSIGSVSDKEILEAYKMLSRREGVFGEPASAASVAGLIKMHSNGIDFRDSRIVCVITGSGLKDPDLASEQNDMPLHQLPLDIDAMDRALGSILG